MKTKIKIYSYTMYVNDHIIILSRGCSPCGWCLLSCHISFAETVQIMVTNLRCRVGLSTAFYEQSRSFHFLWLPCLCQYTYFFFFGGCWNSNFVHLFHLIFYYGHERRNHEDRLVHSSKTLLVEKSWKIKLLPNQWEGLQRHLFVNDHIIYAILPLFTKALHMGKIF